MAARRRALVLAGLVACADGAAPAPSLTASTTDEASGDGAQAVAAAPGASAEGPDDFDANDGAPPLAGSAPAAPFGAVTSLDPRRGTPRILWWPPALAAGRALPLATRASPAAAARWHLAQVAAAYRLGPAALAAIEPALIHDTGRGAIVVRLRQRVGALEVWPDRLAVVMRRDLSAIAITGGLHHAAGAGEPPTARAFDLGAEAAVRAALRDVGAPAPALAPDGEAGGHARFTGGDLTEPARVRPILFALPDRLVPAYLSEIRTMHGGRPRGYRHVIAAADGRLLRRQRLDAADAFTYRAWAEPDGDHSPADGPLADASPHPTGVPDALAPAPAEPALITVESLALAGDPWLPADATEAIGNNVDAFADLAAPTGFGPGDLRAPLTGPGRFDARYDLALAPGAGAAQHHAALTQLFFTLNWLHDHFHDAGFDEEAGNAQHDNLGRGGAGGDRLIAEGHDHGGFANATMFTPGDGASPRMQVYLYPAAAGGPLRDGSLDTMLVAHEWGHYLHHRLVDCSGAMCRAMSEGWGDYVALHTMLRPTDTLDGVYPLAPYASGGMHAHATYFGLRRYPYARDLTRSPLTLRHLRVGQALPAGVPRNPAPAMYGNFEAHNAGEVWALSLFEAAMALVGASRATPAPYTFAEARTRMADYVVAGLIAAPVSPDLTEQRDAILAATATDVDDLQRVARAFARRGLGTAAVSPPSTSDTGLGAVESFTTAGRLALGAVTLADGAVSCDDDGELDAGEVGELRVEVANLGVETLSQTTVAVSSPTPGVELPAGGVVAVLATAPLEQRVAALAIGLTDATLTEVELRIELRDPLALTPVVVAPLVRLRVNVAPDAVCPPPSIDGGLDAAVDAPRDAAVDGPADAALPVDAPGVDAGDPPPHEGGCSAAGRSAPLLLGALVLGALCVRRRGRYGRGRAG